VDRYLGSYEHSVDSGPAAPSEKLGGDDDNMSVSSATIRQKRTRDERNSVSDSDIDSRPYHKVLRSRIIGSDSEEEPIVLSDSPKDVAERIRGRKARTKKLDKLNKLEDLFESNKLVLSDCPSHLTYEDLCNKEVDEIAAVSECWLNEMEAVRFKSRRMNGRLSGALKDRIVCLRAIVKLLVDRLKDTRDVLPAQEERRACVTTSRIEERRKQAASPPQRGRRKG